MEINGEDATTYETNVATAHERILAKLREREESENAEFGPESEFAARRAEFHAQISQRRRLIRELRDQLEQLEEEKFLLRNEQIEDEEAADQAFDERWEKEIMLEVKPYSQTLCKELSERVYNALPRELRDEVYSHLIENYGMYEEIHDADDFWAGKGEFLPWYHDPAYVGPAMAHEVTETYYRSIMIGYIADPIPGQLRKFLTCDRFGRGLEPAKCLRRVVLTMSLLLARTEESQDGRPTDTTLREGLKLTDAIQDDITALQLLKTRKGYVEFYVSMDSEEEVASFACFLNVVIPVIRQLKERDFEVRITAMTEDSHKDWIFEESAKVPILENLTSIQEKIKKETTSGQHLHTSLFDAHVKMMKEREKPATSETS